MSPDKPKLFVDFDATIFDYDRFHPWLIEFLEKNHQVPSGQFLSIIDQHYDDPASLYRLYDHRGHFLASTGMPWEEISVLVQQELKIQPVDFLFPDAVEFLAEQQQVEEVEILTYGVEEYQLFKINLCPELLGLGIPVSVVSEPKSVYLSRQAHRAGGTLVDDKYPLNLPDNWQHVWLNRSMALEESGPLVLADGVVCINSLKQYAASKALV